MEKKRKDIDMKDARKCVPIYLTNLLENQNRSGLSLCDQIGPVLGLHKESVYRRLRGDVAFTLSEAIKLAYHFGISLEELTGIEARPDYMPLYMNRRQFLSPMKSEILTLDTYADILLNSTKKTELYQCSTSLPISLYLKYPGIVKLFIVKDHYLNISNGDAAVKFDDVKLKPKIKKQHGDIYKKALSLPHVTLVLNNNIIQNFIDDIKFFRAMKHLSPNNVEELKKELLCLLDDIEEISRTGENEYGNMVSIYLCELHFDANYMCCKTENVHHCSVKTITNAAINSKDKQMYKTMEHWIETLKKASTYISGCAMLNSSNFLNIQHQKIEQQL